MLAPVAAWNMTGLPTRRWLLLQGGLDVAASAARANSYGVDPASVSVKEEGPGRVSSMSYTITDPAGVVTVGVGDTVVLWDTAQDVPVFRGWIEGYEASALGVGREIACTAVGIESLLDWLYVPPTTVPAGTILEYAIQHLAASAVGIGFGLRAAAGPGTSTILEPIAFGFGFGVPTVSLFTWTGGTLRQAIAGLLDVFIADYPAFSVGSQWQVTVDLYGGLRVWNNSWDVSIGFPYFATTMGDYGLITLAAAGPSRPSSTRYGVNAAGTPRTVYVKGGAGAGVGPVSDGSGVVGPTAVVAQSLSTSADARRGFGNAYLQQSTPGISGSVVAEGTVAIGTKASGSYNRAGCPLFLTDPQVGLTTQSAFLVQTIEKAFASSAEETWTITFGADQPRATQYLRTLTAAVLQ